MEGALGVAVLGLIASEVPDDQGLVAGGGQEHVGAAKQVSLRVCQSFRVSLLESSYFSMEVARLVTQPFCVVHALAGPSNS